MSTERTHPSSTDHYVLGQPKWEGGPIYTGSRGWHIAERNRKAEERRTQPVTTLSSWETVSGMIDLSTRNNFEAADLIHNVYNHQVLKLYYDAWFDVAAGKGRKKLDTLTKQHTQNEKSKYYNPELIDRLGKYISMIRDSFPSTRTVRKTGR